MPTHAFFEDLDNFTEAGRFFVALTERLRDGTVAEEDATRLAHSLRIPIPCELKGASIQMLEDSHKIVQAADRTMVVVTYPPVPTPDPQTVEMSLKKCFTVCQTVAGAKVCAEVCVNISVGMDGVHGSIKATVSVTF